MMVVVVLVVVAMVMVLIVPLFSIAPTAPYSKRFKLMEMLVPYYSCVCVYVCVCVCVCVCVYVCELCTILRFNS
jgi:hypothetical protein